MNYVLDFSCLWFLLSVFLVVYFDQSYCLVGNTFRIPAALRKSDSRKKKRSSTSGEEEALADSQSLSEYLHRSCESNTHTVTHSHTLSHIHSHTQSHSHILTHTHSHTHSHFISHSLAHPLTTPFTHQLTLTHSSTHLLPEDGKPLLLHRLHLSPHQARPVSAVSN